MQLKKMTVKVEQSDKISIRRRLDLLKSLLDMCSKANRVNVSTMYINKWIFI